MLQPREADIPALLIFLVVIPLFTYILLGRWTEGTKKKARISALAHLAAEEAFQVEAMASADVLPVLPPSRTGLDGHPVFSSSVTGLDALPVLPSRTGFHECAKCSSPATTRCSRCKSVRYCSGKCQIIHWRQGHKHECLQRHENLFSASAGAPHKDSLPHNPFLNNRKSSHHSNLQMSLQHNLHNGLADPLFMATDTRQDLDTRRKPLGKYSFSKLKMAKSDDDNNDTGEFDQDYIHDACAQTLSTDVMPEDPSIGHKLAGGNFTVSSSQVHINQETNSSSNSRNVLGQHSKSAGETRKGLKQSGSPVVPQFHMDKHMITACQNVPNVSSEKVNSFEGGFSSSETINVSYPLERYSTKENKMYRKPPYTLGHTASSLQKLAANVSKEHHCQGLERNGDMGNGSKIPDKSVASNIHLEALSGNTSIEGKMAGSKKNSKVLKRNLVGLINDNKKNKLCQLLFPYEDLVKFFQCEEWHISPRGLLNCGNSCYANAVLQCLTGTKPLMIYLLRRWHSQTCCAKEWCLTCELEQHVSMLREGGGPLSPSKILSNMRNIGCRMGGGNQEDAHEFLRLLVMSMQSICLEGLGGEKEIDPRLQETTLVQQIFGGRLRSKVKCLRCHLESERYESIMDLTLEIHGWVESLEDALTQFTAPEDLDGENMYRCARCLAYVKARKQLSLHEVPNILTIVLKRFQTGKYGKINKCVTFPEMLDMIPFVTGNADNPPLYLLYAVVVHLDNLNASFAGHYISYVKDLEGTWFRIDDSEVQPVPPSQVMSEGAYMLFYSRSFPRPPQAYTDKRLSRPPLCAKRNNVKSPKTSKHGQQRLNTSSCAPANSAHPRNDLGKDYGEDMADLATTAHIPRPCSRISSPEGTAYPDALSSEFSDVTSSDWSLFTSSDDSSFTTESTRDSFSTMDHGDNTTLDTISSIFSPFYAPEYTKISPGPPQQTRFFAESADRIVDCSVPTRPLDSVHRGRNVDHAPLASGSHCSSVYGQWE